MSESTTFPHKRINELRRRAAKAAELSDDVPEGWSKSTVDPMAAEAISRDSSQFYQQLNSERT